MAILIYNKPLQRFSHPHFQSNKTLSPYKTLPTYINHPKANNHLLKTSEARQHHSTALQTRVPSPTALWPIQWDPSPHKGASQTITTESIYPQTLEWGESLSHQRKIEISFVNPTDNQRTHRKNGSGVFAARRRRGMARDLRALPALPHADVLLLVTQS